MNIVSIMNRLDKIEAKRPPKVTMTSEVIRARIRQEGFDDKHVFAVFDPSASIRTNVAAMTGWNTRQMDGYMGWRNHG